MLYFATGNRGGAIKVCLMLLASYVYIAKDGVNYKRIFVLFYYRGFFDDSYWHHKNARDKKFE